MTRPSLARFTLARLVIAVLALALANPAWGLPLERVGWLFVALMPMVAGDAVLDARGVSRPLPRIGWTTLALSVFFVPAFVFMRGKGGEAVPQYVVACLLIGLVNAVIAARLDRPRRSS